MKKPGSVALPILLVLGAITGFLSYQWMVVQSTPKAGVFDNSPYYKTLPPASAEEKNTTKAAAAPVDESKFSKVVKISILSGASVQGAPPYEPRSASIPKDALIVWTNNDNVPHSATSGKSLSDADYGKLFDSGILEPGKDYKVPASTVGAGEHAYFCQVHPYMSGTVNIQ